MDNPNEIIRDLAVLIRQGEAIPKDHPAYHRAERYLFSPGTSATGWESIGSRSK